MPKRKRSRSYKQGVILGLVFFQIVLVTLLASNIRLFQGWWGEARGTEANIVIDTQSIIGPQPRPWANLAQGGESPNYRLVSIAGAVARLQPQYIRIDHVFDYYDIVSRNSNGAIEYDFSQLDLLLDDIEAIGAIPFISLSYMPEELSGGSLLDEPQNWQEWQELVRVTIEHISGETNRAESNVYYEVWNEPDLFGDWSWQGEKNYLELYRYSARGAMEAREESALFYFGGPATTAFYPNWFKALLQMASDENLPLDFISWHRYSRNEAQFHQDALDLDLLLEDYPQFLNVEKIISEWGHESDLDDGFDTNLSAAHLVASSANMGAWVDKAFIFEIEDGKDSLGREYWGRWGLLPHRDTGAIPKPRYKALEMLVHMGDQRLAVAGQGSWVKALATKRTTDVLTQTEAIQVVVANYDQHNRHSELVPITFNRIRPGAFLIQQRDLAGEISEIRVATDAAILKHEVFLEPNQVVSIDMQRIE